MKVRRFWYCVLAAVAGLFGSAAGPVAAEKPLPQIIDFNRDIRPIFADNCYACHGPDKNKRKADLRLDTHDGLFWQHDNRQTVAAGKPLEIYLNDPTTT